MVSLQEDYVLHHQLSNMKHVRNVEEVLIDQDNLQHYLVSQEKYFDFENAISYHRKDNRCGT